MNIIYAKDFQPLCMDKYKRLHKPKGNPGGKSKLRYRDCVCAFDIETTTTTIRGEEINFMYIWQFQIDYDVTIIGRTWEEFRQFRQKLIDTLNGDALVIYVHNLAYEWQYIKSLYNFGPEDVFAVESRKVIKCIMSNCLEFRCSLALSNMSLAHFTAAMRVPHQKQSGEEFNYSKTRYPWTALTAKELKYAAHDVLGLVEAVKRRMALSGDTLYTVPLTSTGYPRRDMKQAMRSFPRRIIQEQQPSYDVYLLLRGGFRGGDTHANRYFSGKCVKNMIGMDRSSSYPDVMINDPFPGSGWIKAEPTVENLRNLIKNGKAVIFSCDFTNIRLADKWCGDPYLPYDKCGNTVNAYTDNGRILQADYVDVIAITDIDLRIILDIYRFDDMTVHQMYFCDYKPLPAPIKGVINTYYQGKTALKGIENDSDENAVAYATYKALLNSLYGLMAMDPIRQEIKWSGQDFYLDEKDPEQALKTATAKTCLNYAWGVWVTAWARYRLHQGIKIAGNEAFVYCDTDSVKYVDYGQDWTAYNEIRKQKSEANGGSAVDATGKRHWMGVYECEGHYDEFITLGAKRYAYTDSKGLHMTVSGVDKKKGARELKTLDNFYDGFVFYNSGKTESDYVDAPVSDRIIVDGNIIEITSYVIIRDTTYTLGLSNAYRNLLALIKD